MEFYVVTKGDYSNYAILAVTTDRELADKIAKRFEEYDTHVETHKDAELMLKPCWCITFEESGDVEYYVTEKYPYAQCSAIAGDCWIGRDRKIRVRVLHDTLEGAIKAAAEKRVEFLAVTNGL